MTDVAHEQVAELLGAYSLHAVDPDEAALVERHLADCPRCRAELAEHAEVAALLGNHGGDAPEGLWDRIADALEDAPPPMRPLPVETTPGEARVIPITRAGFGRNPLAFIATAAAAVAIALLGVQVVRQDGEIDDLRSAMVDDALLTAANEALAAPDGARSTLRSPDGRVSATAVVLPDGSGFLLGDGLPELSDDRTYQLWGQVGDQLVSLGVLGAAPDVVAFRAAGEVSALAITEEVAGGVERSRNPATVAGRFS